MADGEVSGLLARFRRLRLQEVGTLAEMIVVQLLLERLVGGLREHGLFLEDGEDTHRLWRAKSEREREKKESSQRIRGLAKEFLNVFFFFFFFVFKSSVQRERARSTNERFSPFPCRSTRHVRVITAR